MARVKRGVTARQNGLTYGQFISGLKRADIALDRKTLADLAVRDAATFASIAEAARGA
jgi:large subunit ribosomal protein L20